ncbi:MAG: hypothetical protein K2L42_06185 [Clostridia bacterium]|nr:hypothetical protein [Clostridia bacterium]
MEQKSCKNCKYFEKLYVKDGICFKEFTSGSCINLQADGGKFPRDCKHWESRIDTKRRNKEDIYLIIKDIRNRLIIIENYFKSGE